MVEVRNAGGAASNRVEVEAESLAEQVVPPVQADRRREALPTRLWLAQDKQQTTDQHAQQRPPLVEVSGGRRVPSRGDISLLVDQRKDL